MVHAHSYRHPWPLRVICRHSPYELVDIMEDLVEEVYYNPFSSYRNDRCMMETVNRIYEYGSLHGSVFRRVLPGMTTTMVVPAPPHQIVFGHTPPPLPVVVQQAPSPAIQIVARRQHIIQVAAPPQFDIQFTEPQPVLTQPSSVPLITATDAASPEDLKRQREELERTFDLEKEKHELEEARQKLNEERERQWEKERRRGEQRNYEERNHDDYYDRSCVRRERRDRDRRESGDTHNQESHDRDRRVREFGRREQDHRQGNDNRMQDDDGDHQKGETRQQERGSSSYQPAKTSSTTIKRDDPRAVKESKKVDLYWDFGLKEHEDPCIAQIKEAYKGLSLRHHPDRTASQSEKDRERSKMRMSEITKAKAILMDDPERKQAYDEKHIIHEHDFLEWKRKRQSLMPYRSRRQVKSQMISGPSTRIGWTTSIE